MSPAASWISTRGVVDLGVRLLACTSEAYAAPSNPAKPVSALMTVLEGVDVLAHQGGAASPSATPG